MLRMFFRGILAFFIVLLVAIQPATAKSGSMSGYKEIDAAGVKAMMDTGNPLVVFPLSSIEFKDQHITGSVNIPINNLEERLPGDKERPLVFYCLGVKCTASWRAADAAVKLGYRNVYAFRDGLPAWVAAGYPTTTIEKLPKIEVAQLSTNDLFNLLATDSDFVLLDVCLRRDADKFWIDSAHRIHVPLDELDAQLDQIPKNKKIVVICLKGQRSPTAIRYLSAKGYKNLYSVKGGMQQWILEGKPVKTS